MPVLTAEVIFRVRKAIKNRGYEGSKPTIILPESWGISPLLLLGGVVQEGSYLLRSHCMKNGEDSPNNGAGFSRISAKMPYGTEK